MAKSAKLRKQLSKLPKAPLAEAVFELRWALPGPSTAGRPLLSSDPGFLPTLQTFTQKIAKAGFSVPRDMGGADDFVAPYSIARRFYVGEAEAFPLMQIGPGIFATNQATDYEWLSFRKQVLEGARIAIASYPDLPGFPLTPNYLELRYVDIFDESVQGDAGFPTFLENSTTLHLSLPTFWQTKKQFAGQLAGRILLRQDLKARKASVVQFDIGSGTRSNGDGQIIKMETKVFTSTAGVPKLRSAATEFLTELGTWLDFAHGVASPLFKDFVTADAMSKFGGETL